MKITITRFKQDDYQTLGDLTIDGDEFTCKTLELPWLDNQRNISCIPAGTYQVEKRNSDKFDDHFHLLSVPDRDLILIHHGNYKKDTEGCILVGKEHIDIDGDGHEDVTSSKDTMKELNSILPSKFEVKVVNSMPLA